ncbi:ankyrin repeat domain-containing protein [Candidatus Enterococcus ferrettii]|uniref:Ankyrin repeat protein n=1 Tax=Candidatus Enterococcus ferrettii TaxID=2815324 RepID=A0ABV0EYG7_9ENTE|nr:ankyrin repeat domain-containing protein [Enterococcus sp. 665A]MBO1341251.1 ankyrin repeat domain-containing protein [Enterococcus sp. 665A]
MENNMQQLYTNLKNSIDSPNLYFMAINSLDEDNNTLLNWAIRDNDEKIVKLLIKNHANPFLRNSSRINSFGLAASIADSKIVSMLIENNREKIDSITEGEMLALAVTNGEVENLKVMLANKFNPKLSYRNEPIIYWSLQSRNVDVISLLVDEGCSVNSTNDEGQTLLYAASAEGVTKIVKFLLSNAANVEQTDNAGNTPLIIASCYNNFDIVKLLIQNNSNVNFRDAEGKTALLFAVEYGNARIVEYLIAHGADTQVRDAKGFTVQNYISKINDASIRKKISDFVLIN